MKKTYYYSLTLSLLFVSSPITRTAEPYEQPAASSFEHNDLQDNESFVIGSTEEDGANHYSHLDEEHPIPQCSRCQKVFSMPSAFEKHKHHCPNTCSYCNKVFSNSSNKNRHELQHTGGKPYSCPHCTRPFVNSSNKNKHVKLCSLRNNAATAAAESIDQAIAVEALTTLFQPSNASTQTAARKTSTHKEKTPHVPKKQEPTAADAKDVEAPPPLLQFGPGALTPSLALIYQSFLHPVAHDEVPHKTGE